MRARFCAFALREVPFLWSTLHPDHFDARREEAAVIRELRDACQRLKYVRLTVLDGGDNAQGDEGEVLFVAEIYQKGKERSFAERSRFRRASDGTWRYLSGDAHPVRAGEPSLTTLSLAGFEQWAQGRGSTDS
jgi:SEC-C motif-containing protein